MGYGYFVSLILGGILGISGLIVAKKPDAKELIGKLQPFQAFIGIALLIFGVYNAIHIVDFFKILSVLPVLGIMAIGAVTSAIVLGILFGMPMVAKMSAGGAAKGEELGKKLAPFQTIFGIIALVTGIYWMLIELHILKPFG